MSKDRTADILMRWDAVASAGTLPAAAPLPRRSTTRFGAGAVMFVVALLVGVLALRSIVPSGQSAGGQPSGSPAVDETQATVTATPTQIAERSTLPGTATCTANQLQLGDPTVTYGFGAMGTTLIFVRQPVKNAGTACDIPIPSTIEVAAADAYSEVAVANAGTTESVTLDKDSAAVLVLGAWWPIDGQSSGAPDPCAQPIRDVHRVRLSLGADAIVIALPQVIKQACPSPPTMSITVD